MKTKNVALLAMAMALLTFHNVGHAGACDYAGHAYVKVTTSIAGASLAASATLKAAGVTAVAHSSGAAIVSTASGGYVAGTLGMIGVATGVITAPVTLIIGGVALGATGGTLAYCRYAQDDDDEAQAHAAATRGKGKKS